MSDAPRLDPERLRRARDFRVFRRTLSLVSSGLAIVVMLALHVAGAGVDVRDFFARAILAPDRFGVLEDPPFVFAVVATFTAIGWVVQLPLAYIGHRRGVREGLVTQSLASAFGDQVKGLVLNLLLLGIPLTVWYLILDRPDWWLLTIVGVAILSAIGFAIGPVIAALFYKFEPLADVDVAARVKAVAERAGVKVEGVQRWGLGAKTTAANAAVMGLGPTKRVVLGDTLLGKFPLEEVEAVVAHEVGHQVNADTVRLTAVGAIVGSATLIALRLAVDAISPPGDVVGRVAGAADPASYPLLAALFGISALFVRPFVLTYIRSRETAADLFGAKHSSPRLMASALVRLADQNLADPAPPAWEETLFYSHPSIGNRVRKLGLRWEEFVGTARSGA